MRSGARVDRSERRPRNKAEEARAKEATRALLKQADGLFASPKSDALARAVRDAQGTAGFDDACAAYRAELGMPRDAALLNVFLDATDARLLADVLEAMLEHARDGGVSASPGLRTRLRLLSEHGDDNVAGAAEDLLERL